ncbi:hypothetical protein BH11VER1_BH11VER1_29060 [soil metagenome]
MSVRFLIVDDAPGQQRLLANVVMFLGGESRGASNGREALEMVKHESFEVVLMDLHMPGLGGLETADQMLQSWSGLPHRPLLLAVTGDTRNDSLVLCRAIGMDGFVAKPYTVQTLRETFKELLIRRFAWMDGPSQRVLSLTKLQDTLPKHQNDFEKQALEARTTLSELHRDLPMMEMDACCRKAHHVGNFAHSYGFVSLGQAMDALVNATERGKVVSLEPLLRKQKEEFEQAHDAVRSWRSQSPQPAQQMMIA